MSRTAPALVLNGLGLANPFVGQGVYALRLIEGLRRQASHVSWRVVAPASYTALREFLRPEEFEPLAGSAPHAHELLAHPYWMNRVAARVRSAFPGAIFHSPSAFWAFRQPPRSTVTMHDCIYRSFPRYLGRSVARRLLAEATERWAARAERVLTDSEFSRRDLLERTGIPAEKLVVLYAWVDQASFAEPAVEVLEELRRRLRLPARFWLYVGGYDYRKNVELLLRAYAAHRRRHADAPPLVLAGRIPAASPVMCDVRAELAAAGLGEEAVILPGLIEHADLPRLYRLAALFVYPSLMEGFGLPPAEAMAVGTPVLAADASSLPEVVRSAHCRFDPRDQSALEEKLALAQADESTFALPLPEEFTEAKGMERYLSLLGLSA